MSVIHLLIKQDFTKRLLCAGHLGEMKVIKTRSLISSRDVMHEGDKSVPDRMGYVPFKLHSKLSTL